MIPTLVVVTKESDWPLKLDGARLVTAREYLTSPTFSELKNAKVFNLCALPARVVRSH